MVLAVIIPEQSSNARVTILIQSHCHPKDTQNNASETILNESVT